MSSGFLYNRQPQNDEQRAVLLLERILLASESKNNGLINGEAVLCRAFESEARYLINQIKLEQQQKVTA